MEWQDLLLVVGTIAGCVAAFYTYLQFAKPNEAPRQHIAEQKDSPGGVNIAGDVTIHNQDSEKK